MMVLLFAVFQKFIFLQLDYNMSFQEFDYNMLSLNLSCLGFWTSWICVFMYFIRFRKFFGHYFFQSFGGNFLFSYGTMFMMCMLLYLMLGLANFSLIFKFAESFSYLFKSVVEPLCWNVHFSYCLLQLQNFCLVHFHNFYLFIDIFPLFVYIFWFTLVFVFLNFSRWLISCLWLVIPMCEFLRKFLLRSFSCGYYSFFV